MLVFGVVVAVVGVVLFHGALRMTLRANPGKRMPFYRNADINPVGSVAMRGIGAGLVVLGAALLGTGAWYWALVVVLAGPVVALVVIALHNRHVVGKGA
ncbi:hypothetical protein [Microbacterium sp. AK031]|uniref:hypothetical protein n=1 Tax=Microbacterium sp. AK031 TaxID=2723076 RepID=UPI0021696CAD|nr:hypothetical protein [Microbacterium sp. AK031]MCS3843407.1 Flp pilus assembly protein TadB [Microbacterium sp. AK031]